MTQKEPWYVRLLQNIFGTESQTSEKPQNFDTQDSLADKVKSPSMTSSGFPSGRKSKPQYESTTDLLLSSISNKEVFLNHQFLIEIIPAFRRLAMTHPVISQVIHDVCNFANTGYKISFDPEVDPALAEEMRRYIKDNSKEWMPGTAGMHGAINKMFAQALIGGAISNEWVPANDLQSLRAIRMVNPETVMYKYSSKKDTYYPYQRIKQWVITDPNYEAEYIPLNVNTFKYISINGDTEIPYGFPPYYPAIDPLKTQKSMLQNIDFLIEVMGVLGFLQVNVEKPAAKPGEEDSAYESRLIRTLDSFKAIIKSGMKDGVVVGFRDEHDFNFQSLTKSVEGAAELFKLNEMQLSSGVRQDPVLLGRDYNSSETHITVVFNKMLASLRTLQLSVSSNLDFGFSLALRLAGYKFKYLQVTFNRSTIQDELKFQQAEEIKLRNITQKLLLGLINQDTAADEAGYDSPAFSAPLVDWEVLAKAGQKQEQDMKDEQGKDKSDKKVRDKNKPAPKDYKSN